MTVDQLLDVATPDTRLFAGTGRHVSTQVGELSIHSFVGGRFPRHRAADADDPIPASVETPDDGGR